MLSDLLRHWALLDYAIRKYWKYWIAKDAFSWKINNKKVVFVFYLLNIDPWCVIKRGRKLMNFNEVHWETNLLMDYACTNDKGYILKFCFVSNYSLLMVRFYQKKIWGECSLETVFQQLPIVNRQ